MKVLVCDDDDKFLKIIESTCNRLGQNRIFNWRFWGFKIQMS